MSESDTTDGEWLEAFSARRSEEAFEALVRRHAPKVLAVCHRVLGPGADAEDRRPKPQADPAAAARVAASA